MAITIVRLGSPRGADEGLRIGTVRRPPRGVRTAYTAKRHIFDVWFPTLAPSAALLKTVPPAHDEPTWRAFRRRFMAELNAPGPRRDLELLAALSHDTNFAVGCYCADPARCHRSLLAERFDRLGASLR
jgi:uncharacterized protein YeaO (DUF488 family)